MDMKTKKAMNPNTAKAIGELREALVGAIEEKHDFIFKLVGSEEEVFRVLLTCSVCLLVRIARTVIISEEELMSYLKRSVSFMYENDVQK